MIPTEPAPLAGFAQRLKLHWPTPLQARLSGQRLITIMALLTIFIIVEQLMVRVTRLPELAYRESVLSLAVLGRLGGVLLSLGVAGLLLLGVFGNLFRKWSAFENATTVRVFVLLAAFNIAWPLVTLSYNYYFDQAYLTDRVVLAALLCLSAWRPGFLILFVPQSYILFWQLDTPSLGGTILAHKLQVLHVLNMFVAFLLLRCGFGGRRTTEYFFLTGCLVAASYWLPALGKLQIGWLTHVRLDLVAPAAYAHGWLANLAPDIIASYSDFLYFLRIPMALFTLAFEGCFILFFFRRGLSVALLSGAVLFHIGVFVIYGFNFWTWALLDISLLAALLQLPKETQDELFSVRSGVLAIVLIATGAFWAKPPKLGWHDTRLTYTFELMAIDVAGNQTPLRPAYFAPYDDVFTMSAFSYLAPSPGTLVGSYGVTRDGELADRINAATSMQQIEALEREFALARFDATSKDDFERFLRSFVSRRDSAGTQLSWLQRLAPPPQFWGFRGEPIPERLGTQSIRVTMVTRLFVDDQPDQLRRTDITEVFLNDRER